VPAEVWYENTDREIRGRTLSDVGGRAKIGVGMVELPPGSNTRPAHFHTLEEEHLYVVEGQPTLHMDDQTFELMPGSYVHFPAAQEVHHFLRNNTERMVRYLMIGERLKNDKVIYQDDSI
jgi:uncharacterized cupin superfamily protein